MKTLTTTEMRDVNGGWVGVAVAAVKVGVAIYRATRARTLTRALTTRAAAIVATYSGLKK